jgi:hypothetical protein
VKTRIESREIRRRYRDLFKRLEWLQFKQEVIEYYGGSCWACDATDSLQVHHLTYRDVLPWEYGMYEVRCLCEECHQAIHLVAEDIWVSLLRFQPHELEIILKRINDCRDYTQDHGIPIPSLHFEDLGET